MNRHDLIAIGASAGGIAALKKLFRSLGADLQAALFVVLHVPPHHPSFLPKILQLETAMPVAHADDGEAIQNGRVYIAPPNRHLLIESGHLHLGAGPRENRARPAINALFRSAALAYGPRVVGVVLSGSLDDGTAGLWEIKRRGGVAVVQAPEDAEHKQMPASAIANVHVDYQVPIKEMGNVLKSLVDRPVEPSNGEPERVVPEPTKLTCPDCHGPIHRFRCGRITEYRLQGRPLLWPRKHAGGA